MGELTSKIKEILDTPDKEVDITVAATVLLKINRNQILYQNIIRKNNVAKLKYELQKIYDFRIAEDAAKETAVLEDEAKVIANETLPKIKKIEEEETKGKRADHDTLPDEIKAKFLENLNIFPRMRKLHEQLKLMSNGRPCDRYAYLKELKELDETLRANWDEYDAYIIPPATNPPGEKTEVEKENPAITTDPESGAGNIPPVTPPSAFDPKKISAARKYLSGNKAKLAEFKAQEDRTKYLALLAKMQERLALLISAQAGVSDDYLSELKALGLNA